MLFIYKNTKMEIGTFIGINYNIKYTTNELNNIFSKFSNLDMSNHYIHLRTVRLLSEQNGLTIINFANMFKDINGFEHVCSFCGYTLAGYILYIIRSMNRDDKICVYNILDYMLKMNMEIKIMYIATNRDGTSTTTYDIDCFNSADSYNRHNNYNTFKYVMDNYNVIQNVRKIINNNDIILFDITDDLQFVELMLLISKSKHKNLPKFIITYKVLYYYLLDKNIMYNKDENNNV